MDLDQILFGLDSFVDGCEQGNLDPEGTFTDSYITLLDQLAVKLRDEQTRSDPLIQANLAKFVTAGSYLITHQMDTRPLTLEMIRVLANVVADVDGNRRVVSQNTQFISALGQQLEDNFDDEELNERIYILLKNLTVDSLHISKQLSVITNSLIVSTGYTESFMGICVLADLISLGKYTANMKTLEQFLNKMETLIKSQDDYAEDEYPEYMMDMSTIVEQLAVNTNLDFQDGYYEQQFQLHLMKMLRLLEPIEFGNKLIVQRRLFATSGNISANPTSLNKNLLDQCLSIIRSDEKNGYIVSISFCIIGNYITSKTQRNEIFGKDPSIITNVLSKYNYLVDPVQFQGILHILKCLTSFDTVSQLFQESNITALSSLIEATVRNSRYYTNFSQLLVMFLKKSLAIIGVKQLRSLLETTILESLLSADSTYDFDVIFFLLLNKMAIHGVSTDVSNPLIDRIFKFPSSRVTDIYIYEMTKTIGVLLHHCGGFMLEKYANDMLKFIELCPTPSQVPQEEQMPQLALVVDNNLNYICTSIVTLHRDGYLVSPALLTKAHGRLSNQL